MVKPNSKKTAALRTILIVLLLVSTAVSFFPCIKAVHSYLFNTEYVPNTADYLDDCSYLPAFFSALSVLETALLFLTRVWARVLGFFLNLFKTLIPLFLYKTGVLTNIGGLTAVEYSLSPLGWLLILLCVFELTFYIISIFCLQETGN